MQGRIGSECRRYYHRIGRAGFITTEGKVRQKLIRRAAVQDDSGNSNNTKTKDKKKRKLKSANPLFLRRCLIKFIPVALPKIDDSFLEKPSPRPDKFEPSEGTQSDDWQDALTYIPESPSNYDSISTECNSQQLEQHHQIQDSDGPQPCQENLIPCRLRISKPAQSASKLPMLPLTPSTAHHFPDSIASKKPERELSGPNNHRTGLFTKVSNPAKRTSQARAISKLKPPRHPNSPSRNKLQLLSSKHRKNSVSRAWNQPSHALRCRPSQQSASVLTCETVSEAEFVLSETIKNTANDAVVSPDAGKRDVVSDPISVDSTGNGTGKNNRTTCHPSSNVEEQSIERQRSLRTVQESEYNELHRTFVTKSANQSDACVSARRHVDAGSDSIEHHVEADQVRKKRALSTSRAGRHDLVKETDGKDVAQGTARKTGQDKPVESFDNMLSMSGSQVFQAAIHSSLAALNGPVEKLLPECSLSPSPARSEPSGSSIGVNEALVPALPQPLTTSPDQELEAVILSTSSSLVETEIPRCDDFQLHIPGDSVQDGILSVDSHQNSDSLQATSTSDVSRAPSDPFDGELLDMGTAEVGLSSDGAHFSHVPNVDVPAHGGPVTTMTSKRIVAPSTLDRASIEFLVNPDHDEPPTKQQKLSHNTISEPSQPPNVGCPDSREEKPRSEYAMLRARAQQLRLLLQMSTEIVDDVEAKLGHKGERLRLLHSFESRLQMMRDLEGRAAKKIPSVITWIPSELAHAQNGKGLRGSVGLLPYWKRFLDEYMIQYKEMEGRQQFEADAVRGMQSSM